MLGRDAGRVRLLGEEVAQAGRDEAADGRSIGWLVQVAGDEPREAGLEPRDEGLGGVLARRRRGPVEMQVGEPETTARVLIAARWRYGRRPWSKSPQHCAFA